MGIEKTIDRKQMYEEVYEFINLLDIEYIDKIPKKMIDFIEEQMDKNYRKNINPYKNISEQNLRTDTIEFLLMLNLKYWCDGDERQELLKLYNENEAKYQNELKEKYNPDNIFRNNKQEHDKIQKQSTAHENTEDMYMIEIKENIFQKIIKKIKTFFEKK